MEHLIIIILNKMLSVLLKAPVVIVNKGEVVDGGCDITPGPKESTITLLFQYCHAIRKLALFPAIPGEVIVHQIAEHPEACGDRYYPPWQAFTADFDQKRGNAPHGKARD